MKNTLFLFIILTSVTVTAQQTRVQGVVTVFRSKYETGKTEFVQNAAVNHASQNPKAQQQLTDGDGRFTLTFVEMNPGETVHLRAEKEDDNLEVVNSEALQAVADQKEPVKIWMCNRRKLARAQLEFQDNAATAAYKALEKKEKAAHTEIERLKQNAAANEQQITTLYQQIAQIGDQRKTVEKLAEDLAQKYARINLDDMPPLYNEAYAFFERGELDSALLVLNRSDLNKKTQEILRDREQTALVQLSADELRKQAALLDQEAIDRKAKNEAKTAEAMQEWRLKADVYSALFKWDSVEICYRGLLALDSTNVENLWAFAVFLLEQNQVPKAIVYFEKGLALPKSRKLEALYCNSLGEAYINNQNTAEAEKMYLRALNLCEQLVQSNPAEFEPDLAMTLGNLGLFYSNNQNTSEAEKMFLRAKEIYERMAKSGPIQMERDFAAALANLGSVYRDNQNTSEAEKMYLRALAILERLAQSAPAQFEPDLAVILNNLGKFYYENNNPREMEKAYLRVLEIFERLDKNNPARFDPYLATTLTSLGIFYFTTQHHDEAEKMFLRALEIRERLAYNNPVQFEPGLAATLLNLSVFYADRKPGEAEKTYSRAVELYDRLVQNNPAQFEPLLARTLSNWAAFYLNHQNNGEAEKVMLRAVEIRERLAQNNPAQFEPGLALTLSNLAFMYHDQNPVEAEKIYQRVLEIEERLAKDQPEQFKPDLAQTLNNYGVFLKRHARFAEARESYSRALAIRQKEVLSGFPHFVKDINAPYVNLRILRDSFVKRLDYHTVVDIQQERAACMDSLGRLDPAFSTKAAADYDSLSWFSLFIRDFPASESAARRAFTLDSTQTWVNTNLALALLFQHKNEEAEKIYRLLKNDIYDEETGKKYREVFLEDLETLRAAGVAGKQDIAQVKAWLE